MKSIRIGYIYPIITFIFLTTISSALNAASLTDMEEWITGRMLKWVPVGKSYYKDAKETEEEGRNRYLSIAKDAISVAYDLNEKPIFPGPYGRSKTLAVMLAIAESESAFRKDVDYGIGKYARGDGGRSWCLMQIQLSSPVKGKTRIRLDLNTEYFNYVSHASAIGGEDLVSNRKLCFRSALRMIRKSFDICSRSKVENRLSMYTGEGCSSKSPKSKYKMTKAINWLKDKIAPLNDMEVLRELSKGTYKVPLIVSPLSPSL